jgi:hypothetical protein
MEKEELKSACFICKLSIIFLFRVLLLEMQLFRNQDYLGDDHINILKKEKPHLLKLENDISK